MTPLKQPHVLQAPAVAVASSRPPPVPRDLGEAWAAPGLFLPRGPQPRLPLAAMTPVCPEPFFPKPPWVAGKPPGLGILQDEGVGRNLHI